MFFANSQNDRARAIGEEIGGLLILEIEKAAHAITARHEDIFHRWLGHQIFRTLVECRHPACTGRVDVVTASLVRGEFVLDDDGGTGRKIIRRVSRDNDQVKVSGGNAGAFESFLRGFDNEVRGHLFGSHPMAFFDADIFQKPLARGFPHHGVHFGVGHYAFWNITSGAEDLYVAHDAFRVN